MASAIGSFFGPIGSAIGGVVDGLIANDSAKSAENEQKRAANKELELQREMFELTRADNAPYRAIGGASLNQLATLLGLSAPKDKAGGVFMRGVPRLESDSTDPRFGSLMQEFRPGDLAADPGYQFRLSEGTKAVNSNAGARGGLYSGATLKALQQYGQGFASGEFQNAFNRDAATKDRFVNYLTSAAGMGSNAAGRTQAAGEQYAQNAGNNMMGAANVGAASTIARGNVWGDAVNNIFAQGQRNNWWGLGGSKTDPDKPYWE